MSPLFKITKNLWQYYYLFSVIVCYLSLSINLESWRTCYTELRSGVTIRSCFLSFDNNGFCYCLIYIIVYLFRILKNLLYRIEILVDNEKLCFVCFWEQCCLLSIIVYLFRHCLTEEPVIQTSSCFLSVIDYNVVYYCL